MASVVINTKSYFAYSSVADALTYLGANPDASAFIEGTTDQQGQWLVQASRILDRQQWPGSKTDGADQSSAWPRADTGLSDVDEDTIPQAIIDACCELAAALAAGTFNANQQSTFNAQKRLKADTVEIENFYAVDASLPLPLPVWQLISGFMGGSSGSLLSGSSATGTCYENPIGDGYGFGQPV